MGVSGSGKSTIGKKISTELNIEFIEGDDFHSNANKEKMRDGIPLNDDDRLPWLVTINKKLKFYYFEKQKSVVLACSALKRKYRNILKMGLSFESFIFIYLDVEEGELKKRLQNRKEHFFNPLLLKSQLDALEIPLSDEGRTLSIMRGNVLRRIGLRERSTERIILGDKYKIPHLIIPHQARFHVIKAISPSLIFVKMQNNVTTELIELFKFQCHVKLNIEERFYHNIPDNYEDNASDGFMFRYCLAPINNEKNEYGRGRIIGEALQLTDGKIGNTNKYVKVFFIDTADEGWFNVDSLYEIPPEQYMIPWQVAPVSLYGITPMKLDCQNWSDEICDELNNILKDSLYVDLINTSHSNNNFIDITTVRMIVFHDANLTIGDDVGSKLFCKFPTEIRYNQLSLTGYFFDTPDKRFTTNDDFVDSKSISNDNNNEVSKHKCINEDINSIKEGENNNSKDKKYKDNYYKQEIKSSRVSMFGISPFSTFNKGLEFFSNTMHELLQFSSPQIPIWTKTLLQKFNFIGPDNKMYIELLPFEELSHGELVVKNPLELHAALLRYQPEDVIIREDILYNTIELEYYSERLALQNKLNIFYSKPNNLCPLDQPAVLKDLNNGYPVYAIYYTINDYGIINANRIEILSVEFENLETTCNDEKIDDTFEHETVPLKFNDNDLELKTKMLVEEEKNVFYQNINIFKSVKIRFLDYGGIIATPPSMLARIHPQFCFLPPFSIQINLLPLTNKIFSIASIDNREFIMQFYDFFNMAVDLKTPMLAIFDSHQGTVRKKRNETKAVYFEDNCEWDYNHVINISNLQRLFPRGIPIDMTIDSYLSFLENSNEKNVDVDC
uniref:gluconokinase n=1 Tax=Parastrongyloides trichosuri TaxID=131310 RepID=A0A0N4ZYN9_PARTI